MSEIFKITEVVYGEPFYVKLEKIIIKLSGVEDVVDEFKIADVELYGRAYKVSIYDEGANEYQYVVDAFSNSEITVSMLGVADKEEGTHFIQFDDLIVVGTQAFYKILIDYMDSVENNIENLYYDYSHYNAINESNECLAVKDIAISHNGFIFGSADFFAEEIVFHGNNGFIEKTIFNGVGKYVFRIENVDNEQGLINFSMTQSTPNLAEHFSKFFVIREASYTEAYDVYNRITEFYSSNKLKLYSNTQKLKFSMLITNPFYIDSIGVVAPGKVYDGPINVGDKVELLNRQGLFTGNAVVSEIRKLEDGHYVTASVGEMAGLVLAGIDKNTVLNSEFIIMRSDNQITNFLEYLLNIVE